MTIRQLFREMASYRDRLSTEYDRDIRLAWHVAALSRSQKFPELKTLLSRGTQAAEKQSHREMRDNLEALSKLIGAPLQKAKAKRAPR
jgi:hypothetical protein